MGEFFASFEDAWTDFSRRAEPLEDFYEDFPDDPGALLEGWLVEPPSEIKTAAVEIQHALSDFDWLVPVPAHFLHVAIGLGEHIGDAWRDWAEIERFSASYARVNCFHSAVVVEVEGTGMRRFVAGTPNDVSTFLPHMTVAVVREPRPPDGLREVLGRLRGSVLGEQIVREAKLVRFPAARTTIFRPWTVEQVVSLG